MWYSTVSSADGLPSTCYEYMSDDGDLDWRTVTIFTSFANSLHYPYYDYLICMCT